jgi:hypothetical protein
VLEIRANFHFFACIKHVTLDVAPLISKLNRLVCNLTLVKIFPLMRLICAEQPLTLCCSIAFVRRSDNHGSNTLGYLRKLIDPRSGKNVRVAVRLTGIRTQISVVKVHPPVGSVQDATVLYTVVVEGVEHRGYVQLLVGVVEALLIDFVARALAEDSHGLGVWGAQRAAARAAHVGLAVSKIGEPRLLRKFLSKSQSAWAELRLRDFSTRASVLVAKGRLQHVIVPCSDATELGGHLGGFIGAIELAMLV